MIPKVTINSGRVIVNDLYCLKMGDNAFVFIGDLNAKRAVVTCYGKRYRTDRDDEETISVFLGVDEHTLNYVEDEFDTEIIFDLPPTWNILADISRYTLTVVAYNIEGVKEELVYLN